MNDARTAQRFRLAVILALLMALGLGSFWLYEIMRRATDEALPNSARKEPDFYVENFSYIKISPTGKAQYHVSGSRLTHNPQDESYDMVLPVVRNVNNTAPPMTIRSERATANNDNSELHLYDNVHLDRPASPQNEALHVTSEYMLVLPDDDIVKTDKPVEITLGTSKLTGTGMLANNATRELHLANNVHGTYQAPAR